jgi:hypothetical protein
MTKDGIKDCIETVGSAILQEGSGFTGGTDVQVASAKLPGTPRPKLHLRHSQKELNGIRTNMENSVGKKV